MPRLMAAGGRLANLRRMSRDEIARAAGTDRFKRLSDIEAPWKGQGADVVRVIEAAAVATGLKARPKRVTRNRVVMAIGVSALVAFVAFAVWSLFRSTRVETVDAEATMEALSDAAEDVSDDVAELAADVIDEVAPTALSA